MTFFVHRAASAVRMITIAAMLGDVVAVTGMAQSSVSESPGPLISGRDLTLIAGATGGAAAISLLDRRMRGPSATPSFMRGIPGSPPPQSAQVVPRRRC